MRRAYGHFQAVLCDLESKTKTLTLARTRGHYRKIIEKKPGSVCLCACFDLFLVWFDLGLFTRLFMFSPLADWGQLYNVL